jgi:predicted amidohydrolase
MASRIEPFSAVILQPRVKACLTRADVRENVEYLARILDSSEIQRRGNFSPSLQPEPWERAPWAPVRLVALPELALNLPGAFFGRPSAAQLIEDIVIEVPGPETEVLSEIARARGLYINAGAYEHIPALPGRIFNSSFLIDPSGEVVHRSHKYNPYIPIEAAATSPHDVYDDYLRIFRREGQRDHEVFFPVTDTDIGRVGTLVCNDGFYPENWRALGLQGAELIIHGNFPEPFASPPYDWRELFARSAAVANMAYVVAPSFGEKIGEGIVRLATGGQNGSFIVDPAGRIVSQIPYPGESVTSGVIDIDEVRRRRRDPGTVNFLGHLRTEAYRSLYADPVYPAGLLATEPLVGAADRRRRDVYECGAMDHLRDRGFQDLT